MNTFHEGEKLNGLLKIEKMLSDMMISNDWSKTKLKAEVRERGICLRNGKEYGKRDLPVVLKKNPALIVKIDMVKKFPLAKNCLILTH